MRRRRIAWLGVAVVVLATAGVFSIVRTLHAPAAIAMLRDSLSILRTAADSCRIELDTGQEGLLDYNARLDSLRARVREMESRDPRGVAADSYAIYLGLFEAYNDSVAAWGGRVDELQTRHGDCLVLIEAHNTVADSLRRLLAERAR
jgi:hypothetical protein